MGIIEFGVFINFLIALAVGLLIGLEREMEMQLRKSKDFIGVRTNALIALFGAAVGHLVATGTVSYTFAGIGFLAIAALITAKFVSVSLRDKHKGLTTELSAVLTLTLGFMATVGQAELTVILGVFVLVFLTLKNPLHQFARSIDYAEVYATIKFAIIALVILPFLPNKNFTPMDIPIVSDIMRALNWTDLALQIDVFNPYKIWLMVVFISGISFVGYILIRKIGAEKGLGLTGFLGGLVSSTAVTSSLALETKKSAIISMAAVFGVIIACSTMFIRVLIEILVVNPALLKYSFIPLSIMALTGFGVSFFLWKKIVVQHQHKLKLDSPFTLAPALKFSVFFAFVLLISKLGSVLFGAKGVYLASLLSGLADVDAITLSMATLAKTGDLTSIVAVTAITIAAVTNTLVKASIAYFFGSREFSKWVVTILGVVVILGLLSVLFVV